MPYAQYASSLMLGLLVSMPLTAAAGDLSLTWTETHTECEVLGLGAVGSVPFNFPGLTAEFTAVLREQFSGLLLEDTVSAGAHPIGPAILAGDLGAPFMHGDGRMYFVFGDAWFEGDKLADDLLVTADPAPGFGSRCIALDVPRSRNTGLTEPITFNGPPSAGGAYLGAALVPGPGFSTGRWIFMLGVGDAPTCGDAGGDCAAANGLSTDVCLPGTGDVRRCYFGECASAPGSPCAARLNPSPLWVRRDGSDFTLPQAGVHVSSARVTDTYRGHFATASFSSTVHPRTHDGAVWVIGRDTFWGAPELTMSPYLLYHPVRGGQLQEARYFAGFDGAWPKFSDDAAEAQPLYAETALVNAHTSIAFEPSVDGGTWLMLYGGHAQPALRSSIETFVRPLVDAHFYDRDAGIYVRWAKQPWGPWSGPVRVFQPFAAGQGGYCENMYFEDPAGISGFACPSELVAHNATLDREPRAGMGGEYGAAIVPGTSRLSRGLFSFRWLVSTWNPYRVLLQESSLRVEDTASSAVAGWR